MGSLAAFGWWIEPRLTAVHLAELLAMPKTRVSSISRRGDIPTVRSGPREARYRPEDIGTWIAGARPYGLAAPQS